MPVLPYVEVDGERFVVPYTNYYPVNGGIVAPLLGHADDEAGFALLRELFPDREVVGAPSRLLAYGGGGIGCITQQLPAGMALAPADMIRTGEEYRESLRDGREVWVSGERVADVTTHPQFKPLVDARARIYDMAHEDATRDVVSYVGDDGERNAISTQLPRTREDWAAKQRMVDAVFDDLGGVVTRVGDETVGEMWSLFDGKSVLDEVDPQWSGNIERHILRAQRDDPFHVSANTDPKGDRSKRPQDQDPDMLLHVVRETDNGIVVRGAKYETAAAYSNQAFAKPTIANWGDSELSEYAVGFIVDMGSRGMKHICRTGFAGRSRRPTIPSATASTRSTRW